MARLDTICKLIPVCGVVADIGCDHGKVSQYVATNGLATKRLIVNDISIQSLQKARQRLGGYADQDIVYRCCDGIQLEKGIDCAVIAGMGGREIIKILAAIRPESAVLSPQNQVGGVRQWLFENGYGVLFDQTVCDNGKFYDILLASTVAKAVQPSACMLAYGYFYTQKNPALLKRLFRDKTSLLSYKQTPENIEKLSVIEEVLTWQR